MKQYKKNLTTAILFIIKYSIVYYFAVIMLKVIENQNISSRTSFIWGSIHILFSWLFCIIFENIFNTKDIYLTIKKNKLPIKSRFSKQDYIANNLNFAEGNIIKYVSRYKQKNGKEDLLKARYYLDLLIKEIGE